MAHAGPERTRPARDPAPGAGSSPLGPGVRPSRFGLGGRQAETLCDPSPTDTERRKERAALWSIAASAGITLAKGAAGFATGSLALISDAAH